jgi:hypothetical protein
VTALGALLLVLQVASPAPAPAIAVDPAIAAVVARFYETQEKEDIEAYLALFSPSAASPQRRMQLQYVFDQGDDSFSDIVITRAQVKGDTARLRVNVRRTRTVPRPSGGSPIVITSPLSVALTLELVAGDWKLTSEGPAADHVAEVLLEASSDAGRDAVLAGESDVPGQQVLSALARVAGAAAVRQDYPRTRSVYETFVFVARRGGFKKEEGEGLQNIANALYCSDSRSGASGRTKPVWPQRSPESARSGTPTPSTPKPWHVTGRRSRCTRRPTTWQELRSSR